MHKPIRLYVAAALAAFTAAVAFGAGWAISTDMQQVDCPTEDSCTIDYRNGQWYIEPDVP
jgi:hypothetical protein